MLDNLNCNNTNNHITKDITIHYRISVPIGEPLNLIRSDIEVELSCCTYTPNGDIDIIINDVIEEMID